MVLTQIELSEMDYRIVNVIKGKYGLKNKSEAISLIVNDYAKNLLEPELRPDFRERILKIDRGKFKRFHSIQELRREIEHV